MSEQIKSAAKDHPRVLVVTPEITYLPEGMGNIANQLTAKAGGLADVSAALVSAPFSTPDPKKVPTAGYLIR